MEAKGILGRFASMTPLQYVGIGSVSILLCLGVGFFVGRKTVSRPPPCADTTFLTDSLRNNATVWKSAAEKLAGESAQWRQQADSARRAAAKKPIPKQISDAYHILFDLPNDSIADRLLADPPS